MQKIPYKLRMIQYEQFTLANGLRFIVHYDRSTPMMAMNILYDVGARDESPERTGFAHLFEHLMFGGSLNIPRYDEPLQLAGGNNNAFTNPDITNYYLTLPAANAETAFWLESDRMLSLAFSEKSLEVQRQVVVEEFRQNYLNQPYGDAWLLLKPLAYKRHPYRWNTIGMKIEHIQEAKLEEVKAFFATHYHPSNAIVSVAGNIHPDEVRRLAEKWFLPIPKREKAVRKLPKEPKQTKARRKVVQRELPTDRIYMAFHMCERSHPHYFASDLITDILGAGHSSRLLKKLVKQRHLFSEIGSFVTGSLDPGLLVVTGSPLPGVHIEVAEEAIKKELELLRSKGPSVNELRKLKNRIIATQAYENVSVLSKAMNLAFYTHLGDTELINTISEHYRRLQAEDIILRANEILREENSNTLIYKTQ